MSRNDDRWRSGAEKLAAAIPRSRLHPAVVAWADGRPAGERWAAAVSGGADSLCLLLLLWAHWPRRRAGLCALHFDHRLRGAASRADAALCRRACRALGIGLVSGSWPGRHPSPSEAEARAARLGFFGRALRSRRLKALWFGHQQDDVAETFLMRLARGSGSAGLAAPRPVQPGPLGRLHLRPLLTLKKAEIQAALRAAGIRWREDASNAGDDHFRNRIRRRVLPAWIRAAGRDALGGAAVSRELLEEDDTALGSWVDSLEVLTPGGRLRLGRLAGRPRALVRRALHRWLGAQPGQPVLSRQGFSGLLEAVERGRAARLSVGRGFAVIKGGWLAFETKA